mgnify:CR=1 FL=1
MSNRLKLILFLAPFALFILASGTAYYFYGKYTSLKQSSQLSPEEEVGQLLNNLGRHILLPNEQPTIATVTDPSLLANQPFFANARVGDKVIIYPTAQKAILYNPYMDKLIEVAYFSVTGLNQPPTVSP